MDVYREQFGTRFIVECSEFQMRLQVNVSEDGHSKLTNVSDVLQLALVVLKKALLILN